MFNSAVARLFGLVEVPDQRFLVGGGDYPVVS